ncbi:MAG: cellulase family glycosylhydrolase [Candidatus Rokuibacteriota bacterium]
MFRRGRPDPPARRAARARRTALVLAVALVLLPGLAGAAPQGFVKVGADGQGRFLLSGAPFRFVGVNSFYLLHVLTSPSAFPAGPAWVRETIDTVAALGLTVIRTWAFKDGGDPEYADAEALRFCPGNRAGCTPRFNDGTDGRPNHFAHLDTIVTRAREKDVRLVFALTNGHPPHFGGARRMAQWCGVPYSSPAGDNFFTSACTRSLYKAFVAKIVDRYRDEPAILAWELANEPAMDDGHDRAGRTVKSWVAEMAGFIKDRDPNHLVTTGEVGFDIDRHRARYCDGTGTRCYPDNPPTFSSDYLFNGWKGNSFTEHVSLPSVDYGSIHLYPEFAWRDPSTRRVVGDPIASGNRWIRDHARIARSFGKPLVVGEYGYSPDARADRTDAYAAWLDTAHAQQVGGMLLWQFLGPGAGTRGLGDEFQVIYPGPPGSAWVASRIAHLHRDFAGRANRKDAR